jgi:rSAM/selenodomain-associated transferase 2
VVIPTLDEEDGIGACIAALAPVSAAGCEIIVSDGGSADDTRARAAAAGARVLTSQTGRARQLNAGAAAASGRWLAFLHADTRVPAAACERLLRQSREARPAWGRFDVRLSGPGAALRVIEAAMNWRSRLSGIATGDQLIFVHRDLFAAVGGFPDLALMEDVAISARLRRRMRPLCCRERICTSSRKWRRDGVLKTVLLMWRLRLAFALGADPRGLARRYYGARRDEPG